MSNKRTGRMPPGNPGLVADRSGGLCEVCLVMPASDIHHRRFLSRGGKHNLANLLHLCGTGNIDGCHGRAHTGDALEGTAISRFNPGPESGIAFMDMQGDLWLLDDAGSRKKWKEAE